MNGPTNPSSAPGALSPPLWVLTDTADAERLAADPPAAGSILALTPSARARVLDCGLPIFNSRTFHSDCDTARAIPKVERARKRFLAAGAGIAGYSKTHRELLDYFFRRVAFTAYRLHHALGSAGPWMVPNSQGWKLCRTRQEALSALAHHMLADRATRQLDSVVVAHVPFPAVYAALRDAYLRVFARSRHAVVAGARKGIFGLLDALAAKGSAARLVVVQPPEGGWRDYARLIRSIYAGLRGRNEIIVAFVAPATPRPHDAQDAAIAATGDPTIAPFLQPYRGVLAAGWVNATAALADARRIVRAVNAKTYVSAEVSRLSDWIMAEAAGEAGARRWVLSRNAHVPALTALAKKSVEGYFFERYPVDMVDRYLFWSPHGVATAHLILGEAQSFSVVPVRAVPVTSDRSNIQPIGARRRVLLADSFASYWLPMTWCAQTSDEYVDSLRDLIDCVDDFSDASLLIRAKVKLELDATAYERLLPKSSKTSMKFRDVPVQEDLADCTVLVAYRTTTIEEALHMRRPVLLWGASPRYRYLPARTTPPSRGDRAAVYAARDAKHLKVMLAAILAAHADDELTDAELAGHVLPATAPTIEHVAREICSGRVLPIQHGASR